MAEIDWDDPLLNVPAPKAVAAPAPLVERAAEVLDRINAFIDQTGTEPVSAKGRPAPERILANDLAGLRASRAELAGLAPFDRHQLLFAARPSVLYEDPLLATGVDIFTVRPALQERATPDQIAERQPCTDFHRFADLFRQVREAVESGARVPRAFRQEKIEQGEVFSLNGQLVFVADVRDPHKRNDRPDARLRVIYDNGTESNLLMSSLIRALQKAEGSKRIKWSGAGPLFEGAPMGHVYVVRSRSPKPELEGLLKVGTTRGAVEDRVARAETQSAFLFAPVEIVETYAFTGWSADEAETLVHEKLRPFHVPIRVTDATGRTHTALEWFRITPEVVEQVVRQLFGAALRVDDGT